MIPKTTNESELLKRIQTLEKKQFDATFEQNYTPRQQAESISNDETEPAHLGKKSKQVLQQELNSHIQNERETFTDQARKEWEEKKKSFIDQLRDAT